MSKLYTKTGDKGFTNLYDMRKIRKDALIIDVLGDLDELSAHIGVVCSIIKKDETNKEYDDKNILRWLQLKLLDIGSDIATIEKRDKIIEINEKDVKELEIYIDECTARSPKLTEFILPGYMNLDAHVHVCRAVCRRAERHMWALVDGSGFVKTAEPLPVISTKEQTFIFMNRMSDFFFALSRVFSEGREITRSVANNL
jgi:cob(I)alamin adenosyltransferase